MISKDTPPGAKIVCINVSVSEGAGPDALNGLELDGVYTVDTIVRHPFVSDEHMVVVREIVRPDANLPGYMRSRFRRFDLPECLTRLQTPSPTKKTSELESLNS